MTRRCYICLPEAHFGETEGLLEPLESVVDEVIFHPGPHRPTPDELAEIVASHEVIIAGIEDRFPARLATRAAKLEVLATLSVGTDHIAREAFRQQGVDVISADGANAQSVAEHTWALFLALARRLTEADRAVRAGTGRGGLHARPLELRGLTLGVIGAGPVARAVIEIGHTGFEVAPIVWTLHPDKHRDLEDRFGATFAPRPAPLIEQAHLVSLNIPLSVHTQGLIDRELLAGLSSDHPRFLVNTARAGLITPEALAEMDAGKKFMGLGLDVYPGDAVDRLSGPVLFTPHLGGFTEQALGKMRRQVAGRVRSVLEAS